MIALPLLVVLSGVEGHLCGNDSHGFYFHDCVKVLDRCGEFPAKTSNLTVIGGNFDGECLVARIGSTRHTSCQAVHLTIDSDATCAPSGVAKPVEFLMVLLVCLFLHVALVCLVCYASDSRVLHGVLFWWSDFWAGLTWNLIARLAFTSGIDDPVRSFIVSLVFGLVLEEVFYDLPLKVIKKCGPTLCWSMAVWILGVYYLFMGIFGTYRANTVALVGHHAILYGIAQWIVDILKAVVKKHVCDCVCQRPQKETYQLLITELAEPLPEALWTVGIDVALPCSCWMASRFSSTLTLQPAFLQLLDSSYNFPGPFLAVETNNILRTAPWPQT